MRAADTGLVFMLLSLRYGRRDSPAADLKCA
jgi:hypothetical protein